MWPSWPSIPTGSWPKAWPCCPNALTQPKAATVSKSSIRRILVPLNSEVFRDQRSKVEYDAKKHVVKRVIQTVAIPDFKLSVPRRSHAEPCREAVVPGNVRAADRLARRVERSMMAAPGAAPRVGRGPKQLAHHGLLTGGLDGVKRRTHAHHAPEFVTGASFQMADESERGEGPDEVRLVQDRVSHAYFCKWSDAVKRAVEQITPVPRGVAGAESDRAIPGGRARGDDTRVVHHRVGERKPHVGVNITEAAL